MQKLNEPKVKRDPQVAGGDETSLQDRRQAPHDMDKTQDSALKLLLWQIPVQRNPCCEIEITLRFSLYYIMVLSDYTESSEDMSYTS